MLSLLSLLSLLGSTCVNASWVTDPLSSATAIHLGFRFQMPDWNLVKAAVVGTSAVDLKDWCLGAELAQVGGLFPNIIHAQRQQKSGRQGISAFWSL